MLTLKLSSGAAWASEALLSHFPHRLYEGNDLPAFGTCWPGVTLCLPTVKPRIFDLSLLISSRAISTLLEEGILSCFLQGVLILDTAQLFPFIYIMRWMQVFTRIYIWTRGCLVWLGSLGYSVKLSLCPVRMQMQVPMVKALPPYRASIVTAHRSCQSNVKHFANIAILSFQPELMA